MDVPAVGVAGWIPATETCQTMVMYAVEESSESEGQGGAPVMVSDEVELADRAIGAQLSVVGATGRAIRMASVG